MPTHFVRGSKSFLPRVAYQVLTVIVLIDGISGFCGITRVPIVVPVTPRGGTGHDILDFCERQLVTLGGGGAIIDECSCQVPLHAALLNSPLLV